MVYTSVNDGKSFTLIKKINGNPAILSILVTSSANIYITTSEKGLWKSTDGINFQQVTNGLDTNITINYI